MSFVININNISSFFFISFSMIFLLLSHIIFTIATRYFCNTLYHCYRIVIRVILIIVTRYFYLLHVMFVTHYIIVIEVSFLVLIFHFFFVVHNSTNYIIILCFVFFLIYFYYLLQIYFFLLHAFLPSGNRTYNSRMLCPIDPFLYTVKH